jgi:hypothetical protein
MVGPFQTEDEAVQDAHGQICGWRATPGMPKLKITLTINALPEGHT